MRVAVAEMEGDRAVQARGVAEMAVDLRAVEADRGVRIRVRGGKLG
jgi:hypothetical protein